MYNADNPFGYDPPSSAKLLRSTLIAAGAAAVILVTVVLPSEYGIDPTGVGGALGLKRMGEIKVQLAAEAEADAAATARAEAELAGGGAPTVGSSPAAEGTVQEVLVASVARQEADPEEAALGDDAWRDERSIVLAPDEAVELKLVMKAGELAEYSWTAAGGALNYNTHGDGGGRSVEYEKGRGADAGEGELSAAFDGHHGWFWRNRSGNTVTLTLRARGAYSELKRTM